MRTIYLIRHATPENLSAESSCGYSKDLPLSAVGQYQAKLLNGFFSDKNISAVISSDFLRAKQTADILCGGTSPRIICKELAEMNLGLWEGLSFREIQEQWPELYEARGKNIGTIAPPQGESFLEAGTRMMRCMKTLCDRTHGNIAIVSHRGTSSGWLCLLMGISIDTVFSVRMPYAGITTLHLQENGNYQIEKIGVQTTDYPDQLICDYLLDKYKTPEQVKKHSRAVATCATELGQKAHVEFSGELLRAAALLHDIARTKPEHAKVGAQIVDSAGYPRLADIIVSHHDLPFHGASTEAELLYLADKIVLQDKRVSLTARFEASKEKCSDTEGMISWGNRYFQAISVAQKYGLTEEVTKEVHAF